MTAAEPHAGRRDGHRRATRPCAPRADRAVRSFGSGSSAFIAARRSFDAPATFAFWIDKQGGELLSHHDERRRALVAGRASSSVSSGSPSSCSVARTSRGAVALIVMPRLDRRDPRGLLAGTRPRT